MNLDAPLLDIPEAPVPPGGEADLFKGAGWARLRGEFEKLYLTSASQHAGGTTEIQKNIIALRGLGLPRR